MYIKYVLSIYILGHYVIYIYTLSIFFSSFILNDPTHTHIFCYIKSVNFNKCNKYTY